MLKKFFQGIIIIIITTFTIFSIFLIIDLVLSLDTFDNKNLIIPSKLTCKIVNSSDDISKSKEYIITDTKIIKEIFMGCFNRKFHREGLFILKTPMSELFNCYFNCTLFRIYK
jgi:hypothetical protein